MAETGMVEVSEFDAARLRAINAYATLELLLSVLMSTLLGVDHQTGSIVFYRITNTRSRYAIMADLLRKRHGDEFLPFWKSFEKKLSGLDQRRNNLIHWISAPAISLEEAALGIDAEHALRPQHRWLAGEATEKLDLEKLRAMSAEINGLVSITAFFAVALGGGVIDDSKRLPLRKIYQRPLDHQTPEALNQVLSENAIQPPPPLP